ncbi:molybdopterin molybdotransferase MoeA [soil metagenome]
MIEEAEALALVLAGVREGGGGGDEPVALHEVLGRYLAIDVRATVPIPGFDNSAMDGFAVRSADAGAGAVLRVTGEQPAGSDRRLRVGPGEAVRIFTGAPLPAGADAVVMQEDTRPGGGDGLVEIVEAVAAGEFVRRRGADLCEGQMVIRRGKRLRAGDVGVLASQGLAAVRCGRRPAVAVVATGDELVAPGGVLGSGQLYNSNSPMLAALAGGAGCSQIRQLQLPDDREALSRGLAGAAEESDMVLVSGGVSVGAYDFVREALEDIGVRMDFWKVRIKPGKPFAFGIRESDGTLFFGLPGNPVSSFVTFVAFVLPAIQRCMGADDADLGLPRIMARAAEEIRNDGDRPHYLRGVLAAGSGMFRPEGVQQSFALAGLGRADALARVAPGTVLAQGDPLEAMLLF